MPTKIPARTLDELLAFLQSPAGRDLPEREWVRLPTFGGKPPRDTSGIWSWDARRLIRGTCSTDLRIVNRPRGLFPIRMTADEIAEVEDAAKRAGLPASTWARDILLRASRARLPAPPA